MVYIVCVENPQAAQLSIADAYEIHEVFSDFGGARRYLERLGFKQDKHGRRWHGPSPWFDQPEDDEHIVEGWIVQRSLTYDFKGEDREFEALLLGEELRTEEE